MKRLVIVGNGMATGRLLDELLKRTVDRFEITVIGDEPQGSYNRIMLSPVLAGETGADTIIQKPASWYAERGIRFISGVRAEQIDRAEHRVVLSSGDSVTYQHLVIATGSRPARIAAENQQLANIHSFRTLDDVAAISGAALTAHHAVVVGGGLLGLEAAYGLACRGVAVTLVHRSDWLLNRQLDAEAGDYLRRVMQAKGVRFVLGAEVQRFESCSGSTGVSSALLTNGMRLDCQLAVIATGIIPNKELGESAGLLGARAICVDDFMTTCDPLISALGECCEHNGDTFGLVEPIWHQCQALAAQLCATDAQAFASKPVATKLKVSGVQVFSAGEFLTTPEHRELLLSDPAQGVYRKLLLTNNRITGIVLFGDTRDGQHYFELMQAQVDVSSVAEVLVLGQAFYDPAALRGADVSAPELTLEFTPELTSDIAPDFVAGF